MKISREWLGELVSIPVPDSEYADKMTMSGSKVEGIEITGGNIKNVVVGHVTAIRRHENSDHLWVCTVDTGGDTALTIVTGAQNVSEGDYVPAALDGAVIAGGKEIRNGEIRGIASQGMLCSLDELGLDSHDFPDGEVDGIFILPEPSKPGTDIHAVLGLGDHVVDFEITNNRPDCLSYRGMARESAVTFDAELTLKEPTVIESGSDKIQDYLQVEIADPQLCPRYTARMVKNIKIAPSPRWMRRRLRASGIRPINNIVDITNYVMLEYGQPMHAFDYACVQGGKIIVRRAKEGETLETLDGNIRKLTADMLVIADSDKPVGIAGIMGGGNSEITEDTTAIVFESANFNGTSIRKSSIALGMRTDASGRYEKGLDPENTLPAIQRACELVALLGAGENIDGWIDAAAAIPERTPLLLEPDKINRLLGTQIDAGFMGDTLGKLGFTFDGEYVTAPSWRSDIESTADLAEEIARFYGYDIIEPTMLRGETAQGGFSDKQLAERELGALCRGMGFYEILSYSFTGSYAWDRIRLPPDSPLRDSFVIQNALGEDSAVMRTTSLPSMLEILAGNYTKRNAAARLYELATVYRKAEGKRLADERIILTLGAYGKAEDFFALKGDIEALLRAFRVKDVRFDAVTDNPSYHPGRCAVVSSGGVTLGVFGQIHPLVCREFDIGCEVFAAELDFFTMSDCRADEPVFTPLPRYPAILRDLALICDAALPAARLAELISQAAGEYLESCELFDVYFGAPIPEGKKSLAYTITLRAPDTTLTDETADRTVNAILSDLSENHNIVIR